eukprot:SAG25_NODE_92_length_16062_cov_54.931095_10_plen_71_part_00
MHTAVRRESNQQPACRSSPANAAIAAGRRSEGGLPPRSDPGSVLPLRYSLQQGMCMYRPARQPAQEGRPR